MKKLLIVLITLISTGCLSPIDDDIPAEVVEEINDFGVVVPDDFNWSAINRFELKVNILCNEKLYDKLDGTTIELYDDDDDLLDILVIQRGSVFFNVKIPTSATNLKIISPALNLTKEFSVDVEKIDLFVSDTNAISIEKVDSDLDGLYDQFDSYPNDENRALSINKIALNSKLKSAQARSTSSSTYTIFEDLWPYKGDYDFNDLIVKTTFSWERSKSNYVTEITGVVEIEWIGARIDLGLGYELFESKGSKLSYLDNVIISYSGTGVKDENVTNGVVVFNRVQSVSTDQVTFTITLDDKVLKEFSLVPYLFRTKDRTHQVRPYGTPPTQNQNMSLFQTGNDGSPKSWSWEEGKSFSYPLSEKEAFYKSVNNHPWGIEFISKKNFKPSKETTSILVSYPKFKNWAESGGNEEKSWFEEPL